MKDPRRKFVPVLSSIYQILPKALMEQADKQKKKAFTFNWGKDRVVSLRNNDTDVKKQWNGSCSSFSTCAAIENKLKAQFELSERSLWDYYQVYSLEDAINAASQFFILEEKYWPEYQTIFDPKYKGKGRFQLHNSEYLGNDYSKVLQAIDNGNPCVVGLTTPTDLYDGLQQVEATSNFYIQSGHAICVSGYKVENGKGYFLVKNSWGTGIGDKGYQYIAFELYDQPNVYAVFYEVKDVSDRGEQSFQIYEGEQWFFENVFRNNFRLNA